MESETQDPAAPLYNLHSESETQDPTQDPTLQLPNLCFGMPWLKPRPSPKETQDPLRRPALYGPNRQEDAMKHMLSLHAARAEVNQLRCFSQDRTPR